MKIEDLKKALDFSKEFLSNEEYSAVIAAIDLANVSIKVNDCIIQSDNQIVMMDFQDKIDAFVYFLRD